MSNVNDILGHYADAWKPVDERPIWQWCEEHVRLDQTSPVQGHFSTDLMPQVRWVYDQFQSPRTRLLVLLVASQSGKTQTVLNLLAWCVVNDPATSMWVMSSNEAVKEFVKKRIRPSLSNCDALRDMLPNHRKKDGLNLIQFDSMNLIMRGSESRAGLQSDPVRRTFCDERKLWRAGAINDLRKRQRTFSNSIEVSVGNAGMEFDELHADYLKGSQTLFHVNCLKCQHSQPLRFGKKSSALFPKPRERGGLVWTENEETRPGGQWDFDKVRELTRYECEACGHLHENVDKFALLKTLHPVHGNPGALPAKASCHWSALYMVWDSCAWGNIAVEFLQAMKSMDEHGDIEPLKSFVCETLGEPWQEQVEDRDEHEIERRKGSYKAGEVDPNGKSILILTVDVQAGYLVYVCRQHFAGARSRLIEAHKCLDFDDLRAVQVRLGVGNQCVWIDSAHEPEKVGKACLMNGWRPLLGDDAKEFTRQEFDHNEKRMKSVKSHWKWVEWDPGCGGVEQGRRVLRRYSWANEHYKDRLFLHLISGKVGEWTIPSNPSDEYMKQMINGYKRVKTLVEGVVTYEWKDGQRRDFADCELMQLVVCDAGNIT